MVPIGQEKAMTSKLLKSRQPLMKERREKNVKDWLWKQRKRSVMSRLVVKVLRLEKSSKIVMNNNLLFKDNQDQTRTRRTVTEKGEMFSIMMNDFINK